VWLFARDSILTTLTLHFVLVIADFVSLMFQYSSADVTAGSINVHFVKGVEILQTSGTMHLWQPIFTGLHHTPHQCMCYVLSVHLHPPYRIHPKNLNLNVYRNTGTTSVYDTAKPRNLKLHETKI
jgi:hypothetical protein